MRIEHAGDFREQRATAYPAIEEQLDAIWKALGEIRAAGIYLGAAADDMLNRIVAIKAQIRKPNG